MASQQTDQLEKTTESAPGATSDKEIARPSGACCLSGTLHEGEPRGTITTVADIETYVVEPPAGKANGNIVLYYPDVWGFFNNGFLVMDAFADAGYLTLGLDYFRGDPVTKHRRDRNDTTTEPDFDFNAWLAKHMLFSDPAVPRWAQAVKEKYGKADTKLACVGYCESEPTVLCA
ncbi:hypothetical protein LTR53_008556 [Teratosphaeriaceae sp. CCFEE 6253]|nr:hypothetical protein LTR53_008556 [Teratosphaeriaceae sp. CCFEE 6253]